MSNLSSDTRDCNSNCARLFMSWSNMIFSPGNVSQSATNVVVVVVVVVVLVLVLIMRFSIP